MKPEKYASIDLTKHIFLTFSIFLPLHLTLEAASRDEGLGRDGEVGADKGEESGVGQDFETFEKERTEVSTVTGKSDGRNSRSSCCERPS